MANSLPPKIENEINTKIQPHLSEDEAHQLLKELHKEEIALKKLIYEFTKELEKTGLEEQMLRNLIQQKNQSLNNQQSQNRNHNCKHEQDDEDDEDEDIDINNNDKNDRMEVDGDQLLVDLFKDVLHDA
eukprot:UN04604